MSKEEIIRMWKSGASTYDAQAPKSPIGAVSTEEGFLKITGAPSVVTASNYTTCQTGGSKCTMIGECCFGF